MAMTLCGRHRLAVGSAGPAVRQFGRGLIMRTIIGRLALAALAVVGGFLLVRSGVDLTPLDPAPVIHLTFRGPSAPPPGLIGTRPPEWAVTEWVNAAPRRLADLHGQVVLVRWFTRPCCPDCSATAPALRAFHEGFNDLGLAVIGMFHNEGSDTPEQIRDHVAAHGFRFPVAVDRRDRTRKLWCQGQDDWATSVTFLLDRTGAIRHIHPGGRYVQGDADHLALESAIVQLLTESAPGNHAAGPGEQSSASPR
jgi:peroxiredoxin